MSNDERELNVATFNIRLGIQKGLPSIAEALLAVYSPDIVAVQEIGKHWVMGPDGDSTSELAAYLDLPYFVHVPTIERTGDDQRRAYYGHALLSRWPITDREIVALPQREDEPRALLRCSIEASPATVEVISTHLSHLASDRPAQGEFLNQWLDDNIQDAPAQFLLGDLNSSADEAWLTGLLSHWSDADAEKQRPTFPADEPQQRIDYVLGRGADLDEVDIPSLTDVSDHRPVVTRWIVD